MPDRYSYPDSVVLINKLSITDHDRWKAVETAAIHQRMMELTRHPIDGNFDLAHLQAIHKYLAHDLYTWGGEIRNTDTHPGGTGIAHCRPPFIVAEAERVFGILANENYLRSLDADTFSDRLAWGWGEMTSIHPFRDINTRSQHVLFNQLARLGALPRLSTARLRSPASVAELSHRRTRRTADAAVRRLTAQRCPSVTHDQADEH